MLLKLQIATPEERSALAPLRAGAWAGALTEAQFTGRNDVLYRHPFGRKRTHRRRWIRRAGWRLRA